MSDAALFMIRDAAGNIYGPANIATLRAWFKEGRIVAGMHLTPQGTAAWQPIEAQPGLADLFGGFVPRAAAPRSPAPVAGMPSPQPAPTPAPAGAPATPGGSDFFKVVQAESPLAFYGAITAAAGIVLSCGCGVLLGMAGAIMGLAALNQLKEGADPRVRKVAIAAIILGGVSLLTNCCAVGLLSLIVNRT